MQNSLKKDNDPIIFGKKNYTLMLGGIAVIILGLIVMSIDKKQYGFGFFGLTLGPIILMVGFIIQFFAIFSKK
ncbi:MAG: DUF3098 domain-containing protein [Cytophagales bacterium]